MVLKPWGEADNLENYSGGRNDRTWECGLMEDIHKKGKTTPGVCLPHRALKLDVALFICSETASPSC